MTLSKGKRSPLVDASPNKGAVSAAPRNYSPNRPSNLPRSDHCGAGDGDVGSIGANATQKSNGNLGMNAYTDNLGEHRDSAREESDRTRDRDRGRVQQEGRDSDGDRHSDKHSNSTVDWRSLIVSRSAEKREEVCSLLYSYRISHKSHTRKLRVLHNLLTPSLL